MLRCGKIFLVSNKSPPCKHYRPYGKLPELFSEQGHINSGLCLPLYSFAVVSAIVLHGKVSAERNTAAPELSDWGADSGHFFAV